MSKVLDPLDTFPGDNYPEFRRFHTAPAWPSGCPASAACPRWQSSRNPPKKTDWNNKQVLRHGCFVLYCGAITGAMTDQFPELLDSMNRKEGQQGKCCLDNIGHMPSNFLTKWKRKWTIVKFGENKMASRGVLAFSAFFSSWRSRVFSVLNFISIRAVISGEELRTVPHRKVTVPVRCCCPRLPQLCPTNRLLRKAPQMDTDTRTYSYNGFIFSFRLPEQLLRFRCITTIKTKESRSTVTLTNNKFNF